MSQRDAFPDKMKRRLRARPIFVVAGVLAVVAAGWLLLRPDPQELEEIVTVDAAGDTVVYSGPVRDAVARARIVEAFNSVAAPEPDSATESPPDADADSVKRAESAARAARQAAVDALARLYTEPADPAAVVSALNLAVIGFPAGEAELPPDAGGFIQAAAEVIERTPNEASFLIAGYATGGIDPAEDLTLSQRRADAVADALAEAGVDSDRFRAEGYGSGAPGSEEGVTGTVDVGADRQIVFRLVVPPAPVAEDSDAVDRGAGDAEAAEGAESDEDAGAGGDPETEEGSAGEETGDQPEPVFEPGSDDSPGPAPGDAPEDADAEMPSSGAGAD